MPGDANDDAYGEYLSLDAMDYNNNGDGCYTFEVRIHNSFYSGMTDDDATESDIRIDSDVMWELDFESYNNNGDSQKPDPQMEMC